MKLKYKGVQSGIFKSINFELIVKSGETYTVPKERVSECIKSGLWEETTVKVQKTSDKVLEPVVLVEDTIEENK
jgi:hypothetical protein